MSLILKGDKLAIEEHLERCLGLSYQLNSGMACGNTLLQLVIRRNLIDIAIILIKLGANVNTQNKFNNTPLHEAAIIGSEILVEQLLKNGADPSMQNINGAKAWMLAEENGHKKLACRLYFDYFSNSIAPFFPSNNKPIKIESQDELSNLKTEPFTIKSKSLFFDTKISPEKLVVEIDPSYVFGVKKSFLNFYFSHFLSEVNIMLPIFLSRVFLIFLRYIE